MARLQSQFRRRIQAQLAAMMLLLAGLFTLAWVFSLLRPMHVTRDLRPSDYRDYSLCATATSVLLEPGRLTFTHWSSRIADYYKPIRTTWYAGQPKLYVPSSFDAPEWLKLMKIDWAWNVPGQNLARSPATAAYRAISVPLWLLILITALDGYLLGRRNWLVRRRVINGQCPACGYDVRATPDHCPECGLTDASPATAPRAA